MRKIIHIDMDAFFASVEQRDFPELRGKPVVVGSNGRRGVVSAASYEARAYGVRSAMPGFKAKQLCPDLIFVKHRFEAYQEASHLIHEVFKEFTDIIEPLSLDEAYLDVTINKQNNEIATDIAKYIKKNIYERTGLTASAGVSYNKFLAKIASGWKKPNGLTVITPGKAELFVEQLPIEKFYGIGKVTAAKMKQMGIHTGKELKQLTFEELELVFGSKSAHYYYQIARAIDERPVEHIRTRKSIGAEETFETDMLDADDLKRMLYRIAEDVATRCEQKKCGGRTLTLKIKYADFTQHTRSKTFFHFVCKQEELFQIACDLLQVQTPIEKPIRLLGIALHNLNIDPEIKPNSKQSMQLHLDLSFD